MNHLMLEILLEKGELEKLLNHLSSIGCNLSFTSGNDKYTYHTFKCGEDVLLNTIIINGKELYIDIYDLGNRYEYYLKEIAKTFTPIRLNIHFIERRAV